MVTEYNQNHCRVCDSNVEHCYLNLPEEMVEDNPLDLENIKEKQDEDNDLSQSLMRHPTWYSCKNINDVNDILCYTKPGNNAANWKIVLPRDLIRPTIMLSEGKTSVLSALGFLNPGLHLIQTFFIFKLSRAHLRI